MSQRVRSFCNIMLSLLVLYLGASSLLPEDSGAINQKAVFHKMQVPKFAHLLAEAVEELSEEDEDETHFSPLFHDTFTPSTQLPAYNSSAAPKLLASTSHAYTGKTERHILIRVIRI